MATDLTTWLLERIAEDEETAREAARMQRRQGGTGRPRVGNGGLRLLR